ncbi:ornithine cyclodeaminase family protein [Kutzneria sp. 744]|uniref:ornithine cyclodeaminase family protein n=1 Tax=Kutzneria sp. (strain 744) TaxID=345341 RepID=UPI00015D3A6E|nr:ornithine cyclodeaminase family protein [Kutzneria sp. 744]ABV56605.1 ornithine cyclodeaminase [Kutzneria sp. 744]EWM18629.1 ornithine cyclodeaminase [Kutzneria sp. 744]
MLVLDAAAIRELFPMKESIELMRSALVAFSSARALVPQRLMLRIPGGDAYAVMPGYAAPSPDVPHGGFGIKVIAIKPDNPSRGLPVNSGLVLAFDELTGRPDAVLDGATITEIRTAAVSGVATDLLARPDAATLAILGAGVQARSHLEAMAAVRPLRGARIWSRTEERARALAESAQDYPFPVSVASSVAEATDGADIICTVTGSVEPVLRDRDVPAGAHVNAVGSSFPDKRELTEELVARCSVFVDSRSSALAEAGELVIPIGRGAFGPEVVLAEIGELLLGRSAGRRGPDETTLFKSLGLAVEDTLSASFIAHRARHRGVGQEVSF